MPRELLECLDHRLRATASGIQQVDLAGLHRRHGTGVERSVRMHQALLVLPGPAVQLVERIEGSPGYELRHLDTRMGGDRR